MTKLLIALQRMRADSGSVVLPGCPIPGSDKWSKEVVDRRIRQGFVAPIKKKAAKKAKPATKAAEKNKEPDNGLSK
jgi:hypothetical protein